MPQTCFMLAIDQGTTSTRAMVVDPLGNPVAVAQREYAQFFPADGWVEQDATTIWRDTLDLCREVKAKAGVEIAGISVTNQRETTVVWDRKTGEPVYRAIVWQDRRTADFCQKLKETADEAAIHSKTGLLLDPYFSATKLRWILENVPGVRARAEKGELAFGTIDSFLLWHLTGGKVHATDASNAARTLLFNIATQNWDEELLKLFSIPKSLLPDVRDNVCEFGATPQALLGESIPIVAMVGDQQGAAFGQACFEPGMWKATYGTGAFVLMNTGAKQVESKNRLLSTVAYRLNGETTYALEGSIFVAGAAVKWLRDKAKLIGSAKETGEIAASIPASGMYVVPAFTGLGAPHWNPHARGAMLGMTLDTGREQIIRATLESIAYQTVDLLTAFRADGAGAFTPSILRVDGGMVANDWFCQFLSDMLDVPVERPKIIETTALGAAFMGNLGTGLYANKEDAAQYWACEKRFEPQMKAGERDALLDGWQHAVATVIAHGARTHD